MNWLGMLDNGVVFDIGRLHPKYWQFCLLKWRKMGQNWPKKERFLKNRCSHTLNGTQFRQKVQGSMVQEPVLQKPLEPKTPGCILTWNNDDISRFY